MRLWDNAGALKRINSSLYLLAAVGLIAAAVMWMMNSPYFPVKLVKIDGDLHRLSLMPPPTKTSPYLQARRECVK